MGTSNSAYTSYPVTKIALAKSNGSIGVLFNYSAKLIYFFTNSFSSFTVILDINTRSYSSLAICGDGSRIVACVNNASSGYIYYSDWNGSNYSVLTQTSSGANTYQATDISQDKSKIVYAVGSSITNVNIYISNWNSSTTNYDAASVIISGSQLPQAASLSQISKIYFSKATSTIFISFYLQTSGNYYDVWYTNNNSGTWTTLNSINTLSAGNAGPKNDLAIAIVSYDNSSLYISSYFGKSTPACAVGLVTLTNAN